MTTIARTASRIDDREPADKLLRVSVVAQRLGVHQKTVRVYYRTGKLRYRKTRTGRIRIPESAVEDFLSAQS